MSDIKRNPAGQPPSFEASDVAAILYLYFRGVSPAAIAEARATAQNTVDGLIEGALDYAREQLKDTTLFELLTTLYAESKSGLTPLEIAREHGLNEADVRYLTATLADLLEGFLGTIADS